MEYSKQTGQPGFDGLLYFESCIAAEATSKDCRNLKRQNVFQGGRKVSVPRRAWASSIRFRLGTVNTQDVCGSVKASSLQTGGGTAHLATSNKRGSIRRDPLGVMTANHLSYVELDQREGSDASSILAWSTLKMRVQIVPSAILTGRHDVFVKLLRTHRMVRMLRI